MDLARLNNRIVCSIRQRETDKQPIGSVVYLCISLYAMAQRNCLSVYRYTTTVTRHADTQRRNTGS